MAKRVKQAAEEKAPTIGELVSEMVRVITEARKETFITMLDTSDLYRWGGEIWENSGENTIKQLVESIDSNTTTVMVNQVVDKIKRRTFTERKVFNSREELVALKNCVLNLNTGDVMQFDKELYQTIQLPIQHDEDATCPTIDAFIKEVMGEMAGLFYEMVAYCLLPDYRFKKFFIMLGEANTGKTTVVELMHRFLGNANITGMTLQDLANNQFSKANLYNKLANICDDLPKVDMDDIGWIKQVTGNSPLYAEKKMIQERVEFTNRAKLIFTCNGIPKTKGADTAFYSRLIIIPFTHQAEVIDNYLMDKLSTDSELSGLLNHVIKARMAILSNNGFCVNQDIEEVSKIYNVGSLDSVASYQYERIICDETTTTSTVAKHEVYDDYLGYCRYKGIAAKEINAFHRRLQEMLQNIATTHLTGNDGERYYGYKGMRINIYAKIESGDNENE